MEKRELSCLFMVVIRRYFRVNYVISVTGSDVCEL